MRLARILVATAMAAFWTTATLVADEHGHAPVPPTTHAHGTPTPTTAPKPQASTTTTHSENAGSTHPSTPPSTTAPGGPTTTTASGTTTGGTTTKPPTRTVGTHHDSDHHRGTHTPPPSPIATKIQSHPQLAAKVTAMLPPGMTMNQAARGFKNQGQFIAALHASKRTGIPFADLKREMVREHESLGQAIHELRPSANGSREAERAEHDADHDLGGSHSGSGGTRSGGTTGGTRTGGTTSGGTTGGTTSGGTTTGTTTGTMPTTTTRTHGE